MYYDRNAVEYYTERVKVPTLTQKLDVYARPNTT